MEKRRRVVLLGNSVILGTMGSSLRRCLNLEVITLVPPLPETPGLAALEPDTIFFDLSFPAPLAAFALLESQPQLKLIGLSPDRNVTRVWSGRQLRELSTSDLLTELGEAMPQSCSINNP